jgi:hypothetical protein
MTAFLIHPLVPWRIDPERRIALLAMAIFLALC